MAITGYVHGYSTREEERLTDQAQTLVQLLHHDTAYQAGERVLEAGCGVGAQTITLAAQSPEAEIHAIDISTESLATAEGRIQEAGYTNVSFQQGDILNLDFADNHFDHVFLCFVLEHLPRPQEALGELKRVLKPGGSLTVIEGDHGSAYFHPHNELAQQCIQCQVKLQAALGGNSLIGRELYPLLDSAGFFSVQVSPRMVYVDGSKPQLIEGFTKNTFSAMVEGVREQALAHQMMTPEDWDTGIAALYRSAQDDGVFSYTFYKAVAIKA